MNELFKPGQHCYFASDSPSQSYSAVFEDDGETAYFYAWEQEGEGGGRILDAVHVYNVSSVVDGESASTAEVVWSADGMKVALLINAYPHAAFDFDAKRGYCRTNFPNLRQESEERWRTASHEWDDAVMKYFSPVGTGSSGQR
jgi:hypothetical protein